MSKQTAVEWLLERFNDGTLIPKSFEIAKAMEKEQMKKIIEDEGFQVEVCLKCSNLTLVPKYSARKSTA